MKKGLNNENGLVKSLVVGGGWGKGWSLLCYPTDSSETTFKIEESILVLSQFNYCS
jgi:hypothetical protein